MQPSENLLKAIAVTAELTDTDLSENAARVMADDLSQYDESLIVKALTKCRKELRSRLTLAEIINRIDDGRPGPEEAWAMIPKNEFGSVVWTSEMSEAFGVCYKQIEAGDLIQARLSFVESYKDKVARARDEGAKVNWLPSLGHDQNGRESVLMEAVDKGRLTASYAAKLLPYNQGSTVANKLLELASQESGFVKIKAADLKLISNEKGNG